MGIAPEILTKEQIRSIYESGPEEVTTLVRSLQAQIVSLSERVAKLETRVSFDNFLLYLDADRERAGERYAKLQQALVSFFAWSHATDPESRAAETLDILTRQITEGRVIKNVETYSIGVARNVLLKEHSRREARDSSLDDVQMDYETRFSVQAGPTRAAEELSQELHENCMKSCFLQLPESDQRLISKYAATRGHDKNTREQLASDEGISVQTLRVRINRIRGVLRECLEQCLKKGEL